ncbi:ATP-binding protein [Actinokineospora soli]|uniref:ATP-binding protein n=1 Tax=Actinokineospora soli TaxID=1048753 RepID=A0ABW2TV21_9PSEU
MLDNCEHVVDAGADLVAAVLAACPGVEVLATSRQSLGVAGEQVLPVPPLDGPGGDAVALFADRAAAVWPGFRLSDDNRDDVARLCARLGGLPLAIELAAARVRSLSPRQIADRIGAGSDLLTTAHRGTPERHRSLRAAIDWSHELCSPEERAAWARLAVFAGGFELDAAEQVCGAPLADVVDGLVDKAVLVREGESRLRMLEPLREYGLAQLTPDEVAETSRRHRDWVDRLTADADADWLSDRQLGWIDRLRAEHANLRAAADWSISTPGEVGAALRMLARVDEYWMVSGRSPEAHALLDRALEVAGPDHPDRAAGLAACALHALFHTDTSAAWTRLGELGESTDPGRPGCARSPP